MHVADTLEIGLTAVDKHICNVMIGIFDLLNVFWMVGGHEAAVIAHAAITFKVLSNSDHSAYLCSILLAALSWHLNKLACSIVGISVRVDIKTLHGSPAALVHRLTVMYHQHYCAIVFSDTQSISSGACSLISLPIPKKMSLLLTHTLTCTCAYAQPHIYINTDSFTFRRGIWGSLWACVSNVLR